MYSRNSLLILLVMCLMITGRISGQVGIGTTTPAASSGLDVDYTDKGLLPPRMTIFQRDAIANPADGLMIFNTTSGCPNYYFSGSWHEYCGTISPPFNCGTSTVTFTYNGSSVTYGTVVRAGGKCWLDRNLGAIQVATSSTDAASYGHLFQWGRLDDGQQVRTSPTTTTLSNSDVPGHNNFIKAPDFPNDWRSPENNNLWQGEGGINNPCPAGFRLPTQAEWNTERLSWTTNNAAGAFASPLKLSVAGGRYSFDGSVNLDGSNGYYWSSTVDDIDAYALTFDSNVSYEGSSGRAYGFSVRCLKD